jgi:hypothetical protein
MKRDEAIALLKEIAKNSHFTFNWISLVNGTSGCEIHIKPETGGAPAILKPVFEKRGLEFKEVDGLLVIYREHSE